MSRAGGGKNPSPRPLFWSRTAGGAAGGGAPGGGARRPRAGGGGSRCDGCVGGRWVRNPRGGLSVCLDWLPTPRDAGMGGQKSAEAVGAGTTARQRAEPVGKGETGFPPALSRCLARGP